MIVVQPSYEPEQAAYARQARVADLEDAWAGLTIGMAREVETATEVLRSKAIGYAWGREDAGDRPRFDDYEFGLAYGVHAARFKAGTSSSMTNVRSAWDEYQNAGVIA